MFEVDLPGSRVVFTTRTGGCSEGPFASRNLGVHTKDEPHLVTRNIELLRKDLELESIQLLRQVHGSVIEPLDRPGRADVPIADGAAVTERHRPLLVTGADCPSVFLASSERLIALHCGWRPVAGGIIEAAAELFEDEAFRAVIGPGICQEHFEVGPEVVQAMGERGEDFADGRQFDLPGMIRHRLERAGAGTVHVIDRCTFCEPELFFSHRRDGQLTGRQAGVAWRI